MNEMIKGQHQQAQGFVQCFVVDAASGSVVKEYPRQKNLMLNQGLDQVAVNFWSDLFAYCSAGTGTTPTADDSGVTTAAQSGTNVTLSGGAFVFTDTGTDSGKVIKWDGGPEAMVVTVTDPSNVIVNNSATVGADEFTVYRTNQTQLTAQVKRTNNCVADSPFTFTTLVGNLYSQRRTFDFTEEVALVTYGEVALGWSSVGATSIFSRIALAVPVPVLAGQLLRVRYELQLTLSPIAPSLKTAAIGGWPVAPAVTTNGTECLQYLGMAYVDDNGNTQPNYDVGFTASEPSQNTSVGIFVSTTATPVASFGTAVPRVGTGAVAATGTYTPGSYLIDKTGTLDAASVNSTALWSMGYGYHNPNLFFAYTNTTLVFVFDEAQTKLNTSSLALTWRFSWSRVLS